MRGSASGRWQGSVCRSPLSVMSSPSAAARIERAELGGRNRRPAHGRLALEQIADHVDAFLRLERARAIDQDAAWPGELDGARQQRPLQPCQRGDAADCLLKASGCPDEGGVRRRSTSTGRRAAPRRTGRDLHCVTSAATGSAGSALGARFCRRRSSRAEDGRRRPRARRRGGELGGLAAGSGAPDRPPRGDPRRRAGPEGGRGRRVLHPPGALVIARQ